MSLDQVVSTLRALPQAGIAPYLVVLNQQAKPVGILPGIQLFLAFTQSPSLTIQQCLADLNQPGLEPLPILAAAMTVDQFWAYLSQISPPMPPVWALTDETGTYLGLLDAIALCRQLALDPPAFKSVSPGIGSPAILGWITQIMALLPLPLMLQTSSGQVLGQNLAWQEQIEALIDAQQGIPVRPPSPLGLDSLLGCDWGEGADALICRCLTPDRQERLWSFSRVLLSSEAALSLNLGQIGDALPLAANRGVRNSDHTLGQQPWLATGAMAAPATANPLGMALATAWKSLADSAAIWLVFAQDLTRSNLNQRSDPASPPPNSPPLAAQNLAAQNLAAQNLAAQNQYLRQQQRLKDNLLAAIAHDLKSPLTAILGLAAVMQDQRLGGLSQRQQSYLDLIHQGGQRLLNLVNDLLDLGLMEQQQLELAIAPQDIRSLCHRAFAQATQAHQLNLAALDLPSSDPPEFLLQIPPDLELIWADGLRLRQMLVHLFTRGITATPAGGKMGLKLERWSQWLALTVWDSGPSLPLHTQAGVFQQLQPAENSRFPGLQGGGMGLILTRRLAQCQGGEVSFVCDPNQGSEFTLLLPDLGSGERQPQNPLILLADAGSSFQAELRQILLAQNYPVAIARSGMEALEKARQLKPGLIFLNLGLPLLASGEVLSLLKQDPNTAHLKVILIAPAGAPLSEPLLADGYLSLPIALPQLQSLLDTWTNQHLPSRTQPIAVDPAAPPPEEEQLCLAELTVLRLGDKTDLRLDYCRVLEADDLEQADLVARIWKPQVLLWDFSSSHPLGDLQHLLQFTHLKTLPLVILDPEVTRIAHQVAGLEVFPCLVADFSISEPVVQDLKTLGQVLKLAAGL
jgi:signal transduction histidine kinase/CheY-like chemotaxis protein